MKSSFFVFICFDSILMALVIGNRLDPTSSSGHFWKSASSSLSSWPLQGNKNSESFPVERIYFDILFRRRAADYLFFDLLFLVFDCFRITCRRRCLLCFGIVKRKPISNLTHGRIFSISFRYQSLFRFRSDKRCI